MDFQKHFDQLAACIQLESEAEAKRLAERRRQTQDISEENSGETLLHLVINDAEPTLGGRQLVTLSKRNRTLALPWNRLRAGTPVVLSTEDNGGVLLRTSKQDW